MKKLLFLAILFLSFNNFAADLSAQLDYIKNNGQWETPVLFKADLKGGWVFVSRNKLTYLFIENTHQHKHDADHAKYIEKNGVKTLNPDYQNTTSDKIIKGHAYNTCWLNSSESVKISSEEKQKYVHNYFTGKDKSKWQSNVGIFRTINYNNLYNNIDAKLYSEATSMKTDYCVHPNGKVSDIKIQYNGIDKINIETNGQLKITTSVNSVFELKPYAYQIINNKKTAIPCSYILKNNTVSFNVTEYNKNYDLIIDPTLVFSTYSGSLSDNWGSSATHDNDGNMFLGGIALGASFPTTLGAFQTTFAGGSSPIISDIAITKLNSTGSQRIYSTYLGGSSNELLASLICTPQNELIAVITTGSADYPTTENAYDTSFNGGSFMNAVEIDFPFGSDLAITKFNPDGTALTGSTFFGGSENDGANLSDTTSFNYGDESRSDVALDKSGNIYITSTTSSANIPNTIGHAQPVYGGGASDGMLAKFNSNLSALNWATYFGGSDVDAAYSIGLDKANNIFICGGSSSLGLAGSNTGLNTAFHGGSTDGFVAKFNNSGTSVLTSTYLGTDRYDQAYILDLDEEDNIYVFGQTLGTYPVSAGVYSNTNARQFIHKLNNNLNATGYSTVFGRPNYSRVNLSPTALLVDVCGNIYAVGWGGNVNSFYQIDAGTTNLMPLTADAIQSTTDGSDFYLFNLSKDGTNLIYASYFGENGGIGDHVDGGTSRFDKNGVVYQAICGSCGATNGFPVTDSVVSQNNNSDNCNMVGVKFQFDLVALQVVTTTATPQSGCVPLKVDFSYTSTRPGTSFFWDFGDGTTSTDEFPTHNYNAVGTYLVKFKIQNPIICNTVDSSTVTVVVSDKKTNNITGIICQGQRFIFNGQALTSPGIYSDTLMNAQGCDSIVILNLEVNQNTTTNIGRTICEGKSFNFNGQILTSEGTYADTLQNSIGCDSIIILQLNVTARIITELNISICEGQNITIGNHTYNSTGNYSDTLIAFSGCDSVINLSLIVNPKKTTGINQEICQGDSVIIGEHVYTISGNYKDTLRTNFGCDSVVNLSLIVHPVKTQTINQFTCKGYSFTIGNQIFDSTGLYILNFQTSKGCDSIINLNLVVTDTIPSAIERTICEGDSISEGNQVFKIAGDYTIYVKAADGCDSLIQLHLIVNEIKRTSLTQTICEGQNIIIGNSTFDSSGVYVVKLTSALNCDSIVSLNLTVLPVIKTFIDTTICEGEMIRIGNNNYSIAGDYSDTLKSSNNCDSIVNLSLNINPAPVINAVADQTAVKKEEQVQLNVITTEILNYNWIQGIVNNSNLQNPTAIVNNPTWYAVIATNPNTQCKTKDSVFVDILILPCVAENIYIPNAFTPNEDGVNDVFLVRSTIIKNMRLEVYNRWGNKVFESDNINKGWDGKYKNEPQPVDSYGYFFTGECIQGEKITLKGNVNMLK
jgi:gliding motility-associated-like protein